MSVWINGEITGSKGIDPSDRGFTLGDGVFETMGYRDGAIRHWNQHWVRLQQAADVLRIPLTATEEELVEAVNMVAKTNGLTDGVIRLTLTRGPGARGVLPPAVPNPTVVIGMAPLSSPLGPARVTISPITRRNEFSPLSGIKSLNYLDNVLARQEASARGYDDVILLNTQGNVAEASVSTVFVDIDGILCTPHIADGALPGVARGLILQHLRAQERTLTPLDLQHASEMVLTNVLSVRSVIEIDGASIPAGDRVKEIQHLIDGS